MGFILCLDCGLGEDTSDNLKRRGFSIVDWCLYV